jgi:molybdopterin molybdotransferase
VITYQEAIRIIDDHAKVIGSWSRPISQSTGHYLGEDLVALCDSPPFDNSAVDGYGRCLPDLSTSQLQLAGEVKAGDAPGLRVSEGQCVRIFTGAPVPAEVAAVTMQEDVERVGDVVRFLEPSRPGDHIRRAGSDFRTGDALVKSGTLMTPPLAGLGISAGHFLIQCLHKPRVGLITTGDEVVPAGERLLPGQIYNSNEGALSEALSTLPERTQRLHWPDNPVDYYFEAFSQDQDVVITCGGVSVGDYDFLKEEFGKAGVEQHFWGVAVKPGKPIYFGTKGRTLVFGLPGNPVSALVTFYLFVRPALLKMSGHPDPWPKPTLARFEGEARKKPERMEFLRGVMSADGAVALSGQNSHQLAALAAANCLIHFPLESSELKSGDIVDVTPLNWSSGTGC